MGTGTPKSSEGETTRERRLRELEDIVKDAIYTETSVDPVLLKLIEITMTSITENRPLFPGSPLEEPSFFRRYFKRWVQESLEEVRKFKEQQ